MLYDSAVDQQCVEEKSSGGEIDDRGPGDTYGIDVTARKAGQRHRLAKIALPNHRAGRSIQRINIIRFGHGNDHRTIGTALDVKRLGVHVAGNRAVKAQITRQVRGRRGRKRRVDVNTVAGSVVVLLRDIDLNLAFGAAQPDDTEEGDQRSQSY